MPRSLCKSETLPKKTLTARLVPRLRLNECLATVRGMPPVFGRATAFAKGWFVTHGRLPINPIAPLHILDAFKAGRASEIILSNSSTPGYLPSMKSLAKSLPSRRRYPRLRWNRRPTEFLNERLSLAVILAPCLKARTRLRKTKDPSNAALGRTSATSNSRTDLSRCFTFNCPLCPVQLRGIIANRVA